MQVGLLSLLTLTFVAAKVFGVIDWNWLWVLFPTLVGVGLFVLFMVFITLVTAIKGKY